MNRIVVTGIAAVLAFASLPAAAQDFESSGSVVRGGGAGWSVLSGKTVGAGTDVLHTQVGWPGIGLEYLHGVTSKFDFGVKFNFNYGIEGMVDFVEPGLKLAPEVRFNFLERGKINFGLKAAPGFFVYFPGGDAIFGLNIPMHLALGIRASDAIMINAGFDLPMWVSLTGGGESFWIPILFGGGIEYHIDQNLLFSFNLRMGPTIRTAGGSAQFTMEALMGIGFRL